MKISLKTIRKANTRIKAEGEGNPTLESIVEDTGLTERQGARFIEYMETLFPVPETGFYDWEYAKEWASRFKLGVEYKTSDTRGQELLDKLYKKY